MFSWPANYDSCYTLAGVISREGIGLHSGEKTRVTISSYEKEGYYVSFRDKPNNIFKLTQDLIGSTMLCTAVKLGGEKLVYYRTSTIFNGRVWVELYTY